jgi:hypothetical protein
MTVSSLVRIDSKGGLSHLSFAKAYFEHVNRYGRSNGIVCVSFEASVSCSIWGSRLGRRCNIPSTRDSLQSKLERLH